MKHRLLIILALLVISITGCSEKKVNMDNVYKNLDSEYPNFIKVDNDTLNGVYGIDISKFKSYLVVMEESSTTSKMYAVFEATDKFDDSLYEAKYFVDKYKESWLNGYFESEEALVKQGELETYGNYIIYVVNEDPEKIIKMIKES